MLLVVASLLYAFASCAVWSFGVRPASDVVSSGVVDCRLSLTFCNCVLQVAAIFAACAGAYPNLIDTKHRKNIHVFQFLYYISSFFGLFGSHTTSFLLSAEVRCLCMPPVSCDQCPARACCRSALVSA